MADGNEGVDERIITIISNLYAFCNFEAQFLFSVKLCLLLYKPDSIN